jgi:hypothetical protein
MKWNETPGNPDPSAVTPAREVLVELDTGGTRCGMVVA